MRWLVGILGSACLLAATSPIQAQPLEQRLEQPSHPAPRGAPHVVVEGPRDARQVVVFLHGWRGCAAVLAGEGTTRCHPTDAERQGWALARRHRDAGVDAMLVVAQLGYRKRDGSPGRFAESGFFDRWLAEVVGQADTRGRQVTLVAHSAGFETAATIIDDPRRRTQVHNVVLLDALYARERSFSRWLGGSPERRLVSLYMAGGKTARINARLRRRLTRAGIASSTRPTDTPQAALTTHRALLWRTRTPHGRFPHEHYTRFVAALLGRDSASATR